MNHLYALSRTLILMVVATSVAVYPARIHAEPAADDSRRVEASPVPLQGARYDERCTPGYDPCIPPGPDVDCAGGRGDGPRYIEGPVYVTGSDPYDLDRDRDGIGCERRR